ncbi:hypothetical protein IQ241_12700 [Romeria aff. gracilis LEGE 07310]|uniref:Uncharacterized protein n=1 Tax=Vasconcelosia minhoensis LEGE 07310 TaxID=915328 RepID=A0A8J7DRB0_9CYAN|nr:hypothetical protein [Romeria gracilis]MBE9078139.1 hypothetical protein [Romeria aff. gracilis LEGE 07310]
MAEQTQIDRIEAEVTQINADLEQIKTTLDAVVTEQKLTNVRVETYQKASGQVVNLAFGLIATAVISIIANILVSR